MHFAIHIVWRANVICTYRKSGIARKTTVAYPELRLIRYKTIDNCLRNRYRRWTLDDLVEACSDALYDMEGITKGVCARTVQMDIQIMRSDKLGYNAPIEVYDRIYYRYSDPDYSITEMPLSIEDCKLIKKAIILLENKKDKNNEDTIQVLNKVQDRLKSILNFV